ncbi:MAG TPA: DUF6265 family protein [Thermoanaerobaculia bacterium]|nr:DUF6265 family protein [Thermoanaerobaculia bacterium]
MKKTVFALLIVFAANARAADLPGWMAGSWRLKTADVTMEEHWTSAGGTLMLGMHRDVSKRGKTSFEFLRIERKDDGTLVYLAMPGGSPATPFPLKTITASRVVFENPTHDFPQRVIYWLDGKKLCARVGGTIGGKEEGEQWCWSRVAGD